MHLTSPAFSHNGKIPSKYTCDGANINPELHISDVPHNAKSLALIFDDPDIPDFVREKFKVQAWDHWVVFNMPTNITTIKENSQPNGTPGKNTSAGLGYQGPCPPDREHRYFFKVYALDSMLSLKNGATKADVEKAIQGHILEKAELVGRYERVKIMPTPSTATFCAQRKSLTKKAGIRCAQPTG